MPTQGCQRSRDRRPFHSKSATFVVPGAFLDRFGFSVGPNRLARWIRPWPRQLSKQFLCENRKSRYLREIVGSNRAPCEAQQSLGFPWIHSSESGLINGLRRFQMKLLFSPLPSPPSLELLGLACFGLEELCRCACRAEEMGNSGEAA